MMRRARDDAGFTLVEIMAAVAILGVVIVPLTGGIILGLRTINSTTNRYSSSNDAQVLSRYLTPDVQSANAGLTAGFSACTGVSDRKLELTSDPQGAELTRTIVYWVRGASAGDFELARSVWSTGSCTSGPPQTTTVVARNIASPTDVTADETSLGYRLTVTEAPAQNEETGYTFRVSAERRAS